MDSSVWIILFLSLFITSFGLFWFVTISVGVFSFFIGLMSLLYAKLGNVDKFYNKCIGNPLSATTFYEGGLSELVNRIVSPKKTQKFDSRVTGSDLIDSSLQEILGYIIRDYISPWYSQITTDTEFTDITVRRTAQTFAVNISTKVKDIDWIPYLTTRLVDDAASHLRLFKQARAKLKMYQMPKSAKGSPAKDSKLSPRKASHKRNKSETDLNWYQNKKETERYLGQPKVNASDGKKLSLEDHFFDLECQMEDNKVCRDGVCEFGTNEKEFIAEFVEIILFLFLPEEDFLCQPLRYLLREILACGVFLPLFSLLSDPDYINQSIIRLCMRSSSLPSEIFLTVLRITDNCDELKSTKDLISKEIQTLRSRDIGGDDVFSIKQQIGSLMYVSKLIDTRLSKMETLEITDVLNLDDLDNVKKIDLCLDQILKNNVALSYYMDFITTQGKQLDLFFYLNVEGWKVSVEQQLSDLHINKLKSLTDNDTAVYDTIRTTAFSIFEQYLGDKSLQKVQIKPALVQTLYFKIRNLNEVPHEQWFDDAQNFVRDKMEFQNDYLPAFKKSPIYVKLLRELDLLQQNATEEDAVSVNSDEILEVGMVETNAGPRLTVDYLTVDDHAQRNGKHSRSLSDVAVANTNLETCLETSLSDSTKRAAQEIEEKSLKTGKFSLSSNIIETGIVCEKGKTFGIYAIKVSRQYDTGFLEEWHIYRRYSDFYDLYTKIKDKFPDLSKVTFPGKKTFHNMDRSVLERRMKMLGYYMHEVCQASVVMSHTGLKELLMTFLEQGDYDKATGGPISSTINTLVMPLKSGMKTIKNMPEQLINTVDEVMGGISKVFHTKSRGSPEASKVGASIEETDDNIPLRIILLLMDEIFDLKSRNQWLRRRIVTLIRQIVRTMFGDIVNRKILDYVTYITCPKNIAHYLYIFKQSFWPNGNKYEGNVERDDDTKNRTRVAAKVALLSCLSDDLKHIIGSETTRKGLLTVFELFQRPVLNRRLIYVLLEGVTCTLFPEKDLLTIFHRLHSKSKRIQNIRQATR